eukprot:3480771-Rhodomonas_salina.1
MQQPTLHNILYQAMQAVLNAGLLDGCAVVLGLGEGLLGLGAGGWARGHMGCPIGPSLFIKKAARYALHTWNIQNPNAYQNVKSCPRSVKVSSRRREARNRAV